MVIEEVRAGGGLGGRTPFRPDTPKVVAVAPWQHFPMGLLAQHNGFRQGFADDLL